MVRPSRSACYDACGRACAHANPRDQAALRARPHVHVDEIAAIAADAAELGLLQGPGMQIGWTHAGDADIGGLAADMLGSIAGEAAAPAAAVAVDSAVIGKRAIARNHLHG